MQEPFINASLKLKMSRDFVVRRSSGRSFHGEAVL